MKNRLENNFISKFELLNSQEDSEEIIWSSDSSDYENSFNDENAKMSKHTCSKKRKRLTNRSKISKNTSQLNITFIESGKNNENKIKLSSVTSTNKSPKRNYKSPLLTSSQKHFLPYSFNKKEKSPIILSRTNSCNYKEKFNSPVLSFKHVTPIKSPKVRKKLFSPNSEFDSHRCKERSTSPILNLSQRSMSITCKETKQIQDNIQKNNLVRNLDNVEKNLNNIDNNTEILPKITSSVPLIEKVKSYFDSHFSTNTSQSASISECETENERNSSKSIEEIEIVNSQPEIQTIVKSESKNSIKSFSSYENDTQISKKVKYKKDGLAFRLDALKKKRNANTSLWLHEQYLAANSNFILPSEDFLTFRIINIDLKFGCHLIKVSDVNSEEFLIILNNIYVHNNNIEEDAVLKVFKPYKILVFSDYKLIVNLCKYECVVMKANK